MPLRRHPLTLKYYALQNIINNFEILCYGRKYAKGSKELAAYIDNEGYKEVRGPFADWPSAMLQDLMDALYRYKH